MTIRLWLRRNFGKFW